MRNTDTKPIDVDVVHVRVFLEGVLFPYVSRIQITDTPGSNSCSITIPPSHKLRIEEWVGATLHVFYANKRVLENVEEFGANDRTRASRWPILFQGELASESSQLTVNAEYQTINFVGHGRHWSQTHIFNYNPEREGKGLNAAFSKEAALLMGNKEYQLEVGAVGLAKHSQLFNRLTELQDRMDDELGRNIAYTTTILEILKMARDVHPLFKSFDDRFRLVNRFAAYADPDVHKVLDSELFKQIVSNRIDELPSEASLMTIMNLAISILKYDWNHFSQPILRDSAYKNLDKYLSGSGQKTVSQRVDDVAQDIIRSVNEKAEVAAKMTSGLYVPDVPSQGPIQSVESYNPYMSEDARELDKYAQDLLKYRDELNEFAVTPNMEFSSPPVCNVFAPSNVQGYGISRNFLQEPTRLVGFVSYAGDDSEITEWHVAPSSQTFKSAESYGIFSSNAAANAYKNSVLVDNPSYEVSGEEREGAGVSLDIGPAVKGKIKNYSVSTGQVQISDELMQRATRADSRTRNSFNARPLEAVKRWGYLIDLWKSRYNLTDKEITRETMYGIIHTESRGKTNPKGEGYKKSQYLGLLQQGNSYLVDAQKQIVKMGITPEQYMQWFGLDINKQIKPRDLIEPGNNSSEKHASRAIGMYLAYAIKYSSGHRWNPDIMPLHHQMPAYASKYFSFSNTADANRWFNEVLPTLVHVASNGDEKPAIRSVMYVIMARNYRSAYLGGLPSDPSIPQDINIVESLNDIKDKAVDFVGGLLGVKEKVGPEFLSSNVTPEEMRRGIIAEYYHMNEWYLNMLPSGLTEGSDDTPIYQSGRSMSPRRRYVNTLVEAEFYRRRFMSRQVDAVVGGFNPYPVTGFPGLIMSPSRPVLGQVTHISHSIDVAGAQGSTSIQMQSPRYWDEGEVWHWVGGWDEMDLRSMNLWNDENPTLYQKFPFWHNRNVVPQNSIQIPVNMYSKRDIKDEKSVAEKRKEERKALSSQIKKSKSGYIKSHREAQEKRNEKSGVEWDKVDWSRWGEQIEGEWDKIEEKIWRGEYQSRGRGVSNTIIDSSDPIFKKINNLINRPKPGGAASPKDAIAIQNTIEIKDMLVSGSFKKRTTPIDEFYEFMIGCEAIDYVSNHADPEILTESNIKSINKDRVIPKGFDVHPQTLAIREYNTLIASTISEDDAKRSSELIPHIGKFKPGTIAYKFWGLSRPEDIPETNKSSLEVSQEYSERYGVREEDLLIKFLGNQPNDVSGRLVYTGPTFSGSFELSLMQVQILDYIKDISRRGIGGGV